MTTTDRQIKNALTLTAGRWTRQGERIESDLAGVSFLRMDLHGARVEVYSDREGCGAASVIIGNAGHLIVPTFEMRTAFRLLGCVDMHAASE